MKEVSSQGAETDKTALQGNDELVEEKIVTAMRKIVYLFRQVDIFSICVYLTGFSKGQVQT